jgi:hypothetical protein
LTDDRHLDGYHTAAGRCIRTVQVMRTVLSSALSRAMREDLISRNVARLVELAGWERQPITPWSAIEARAFLEADRQAQRDALGRIRDAPGHGDRTGNE